MSNPPDNPKGKIRTALAGYGKLVGLSAGLAVLIVGGAFWALHRSSQKEQSGVSLPAPALDRPGKAGSAATPEYRRMVGVRNRSDEQAALKAGKSFVPNPLGPLGPAGPSSLPTTPSPPIPTKKAGALQNAARRDQALRQAQELRQKRALMERERQKAESLRDKAMLSEMAAINNSVYGTGLDGVAVADDLPSRTQQAPAPRTASVSKKTPSVPPLPASLLKLLRPGRIYYGEVDTEVNSDVPGPVLATIQTGKLKGARLLGGFTKAGDYVVLKFDSMTLPNSDVYPVTAYALNPHKLQAGMATDVNHHYIERYGSMLLGAFLYGFGQAEMYSGGTGTVTQFGAPVFIPQMNSVLSQSALGLGMAGQQLASVTQQNFNIPATVHLHQNDPVAILIIRASAPKTVSAPAAPAQPARAAAPLPPVGPFGGTSPYGGGYGGSPYGGYPGGGLPMMPMMP